MCVFSVAKVKKRGVRVPGVAVCVQRDKCRVNLCRNFCSRATQMRRAGQDCHERKGARQTPCWEHALPIVTVWTRPNQVRSAGGSQSYEPRRRLCGPFERGVMGPCGGKYHRVPYRVCLHSRESERVTCKYSRGIAFLKRPPPTRPKPHRL